MLNNRDIKYKLNIITYKTLYLDYYYLDIILDFNKLKFFNNLFIFIIS